MLQSAIDLIQIETYPEPMKVNNSKNLSYGRVHIDETCLDIFQLDPTPIKPWRPSPNNYIKPYDQLRKWYLDIETAGLNPLVDRLYLNGVKDSKGTVVIFDDEDERRALLKFVTILCQKKPEILFTFNGTSFDLPFIMKRCDFHGIKHPFHAAKKQTVHATAVINNQPSIYTSIWIRYEDGTTTAHIDLFHQLLSYDFVARKLTRWNLKDSPLQLKLRKEPRLDLSYAEILDCWQSDRDKLKSYLSFDLDDTELLANFLAPAIYYQLEYLPNWKIQTLGTAGNGSKWNDIFKRHYGRDAEPTPKHNYKGALTSAENGYFANIAKVDVKSLYPNCQRLYGIHSEKDTDRHGLSVLSYVLDEKDRLGALKEAGDRVAAQRQGTTKVIANSAYGALGSSVPYNDYKAAAMVTAYGRAVLRFMVNFIGGYSYTTCISTDTDGCYYAVSDDESGDRRKEIHEALQAALPPGIVIQYELKAKAMFIPANETKVKAAAKEATIETIEDEDLTKKWDGGLGIRKSYIIVYDDGKVSVKGRYAKRNRAKIDTELQPELCRLLAMEGEDAAIAYYEKIQDQIEGGYLDIEYIMVRRTVAISEKALYELGLVDDDKKTEFYWGYGQPKPRSKKIQVIQTNSAPYSIPYYQDHCYKLAKEVLGDLI
jgi:DNA polymerase, archaea type